MTYKLRARLLIIFILINFSINIYSIKLNYSFSPDIFIIINTEIDSKNYLNGNFIGESKSQEISSLNTKSFDGDTAKITKTVYYIEDRAVYKRQNKKFLDKESYTYKKNIFGKTNEWNSDLGFHDFPRFPDKNLEIGDTWEMPSKYVVKLYNKSDTIKVDILVQYRLIGIEKADNIEYAKITANTVFIKDSKQLNNIIDANTIKLGGYSNFSITFDVTNNRLKSIEEIFDYFYVLNDYSILESAGKSNTEYKKSQVFSKVEVEKIEEIVKDEKEITVTLQEDKTINVTLENIRFEPDSVDLLPGELKRLDKIASILENYRFNKIIIYGYTADIGEPEAQKLLSEQRAKYIMDLLINKYNFDRKNFKYVGMGGEGPIADNNTEEGRAKNRRVEIVITPVKE